jgi:ribosomal protein L29
MGQLVQILEEKEDQLMKMRAAKESETASKDHELEELAKKIPGN